MEFEETFREAVIWALVLGVAVWLLGGFVKNVQGQWHDGLRTIRLRQIGPIVWGKTQWQDGWQRYRGTVFWGHLKLRRHDGGAAHLTGLGFTAEQLPALRNQIMAHVAMRLVDNNLDGFFYGRRFSFAADQKTIVSVAVHKPERRVWRRAAGPKDLR